MKNEFMQGYVCSIAYLIRDRDEPLMACELLDTLGVCKIKELEDAGCDECDLKEIRKMKYLK